MAATKEKKPLTEEALLRMPEADYMNEAQLAFFREKLQQMAGICAQGRRRHVSDTPRASLACRASPWV